MEAHGVGLDNSQVHPDRQAKLRMGLTVITIAPIIPHSNPKLAAPVKQTVIDRYKAMLSLPRQ
jgi:hypothetical protein